MHPLPQKTSQLCTSNYSLTNVIFFLLWYNTTPTTPFTPRIYKIYQENRRCFAYNSDNITNYLLPTNLVNRPLLQILVAPQQLPGAYGRLNLNRKGHLRGAPLAVRKIKRRLPKLQAQLMRQIDHLHLERIAIRKHPL